VAERRTFPRSEAAPAGPARNWKPAQAFLLRLLLAAGLGCALHADTGTFGVQVGAALPMGGMRQWVGSGPGVSVDLMNSFDLAPYGVLRMRLGYCAWQGIGTNSQSIALPGSAEATFPASSNDQLFIITYGADYLYNLRSKAYLLGGLGFGYLTASRSGTLVLASVGSGSPNYRYDANKLTPYACLGAGYPLARGVAAEGRFQVTNFPSQVRRVDLTQAGYTSPAQASFSGFVAASFTLGLTFSF